MKKHKSVPTLCLFLCLIIFSSSCSDEVNNTTASDEHISDRPNIIVILADDLGYDHLSCYGQKIIRTPHIDQLAAEGVKFTQFYSGASVCAPARSTLLTGQHTGHTRIRWNRAFIEHPNALKRRVPLQDEDITIAELLKKNGYVTGVTGKWGLGEPGSSGIPNNQGFDQWFGYLNQKNAHSYYPEYLWRNQDSVVLEGNLNNKNESYSHHLIHDFALDFIESQKDTSFFLYLPYTLPHGDFEIPDMGRFADSTSWTEEEKVYAAMVELLDEHVGELVEKLESSNISERTVLLLVSDNGSIPWARFDFDGLKASKGSLYEGGIRVPMIVKYPKKVKPAVSEHITYLPDIFPTLADFANAEYDKDVIDGKTLQPILVNNTPINDRLLYWEQPRGGFQQAVRKGPWKMIKTGDSIELYNLMQDKGELENIRGSHPAVVDSLLNSLDTLRTESLFWPV